MLKVLCFDCGVIFEVPYNTRQITKQCPQCKIPGYKQTPPDWCDDCTIQDSVCTICGCTHNC